ncbi:hypothetical protein DENIS_2039 [Desulfonema ishimotonii]|uniref:Uncharacterized protein n=1 Tax=Desulfonema ishimotonii TaxID=45657 RepID=A0A401FVU7_9BACT|nr:hypothetical protein DENIS_2039 [Desulfonema ishimotonii]
MSCSILTATAFSPAEGRTGSTGRLMILSATRDGDNALPQNLFLPYNHSRADVHREKPSQTLTEHFIQRKK